MVRSVMRMSVWLLVFVSCAADPGIAQTDYYNLDRGHPVRIEDAFPTERYAFELKVPSVRVDRHASGIYTWRMEPGLVYGILARTDLGMAIPVSKVDRGGEPIGLAGIEFSVFHNLNLETRSLPAFAVRGDVTLPVGPYAPRRAVPSATAIATRSFGGARIHLNARYTLGDLAPGDAGFPSVDHGSRWLAGAAIDRALPLRSLILIADLYAAWPLDPAGTIAWTAGGGARAQITPRAVVDVGVGRRMTGHTGWHATAGTGIHFALGSIVRGRR